MKMKQISDDSGSPIHVSQVQTSAWSKLLLEQIDIAWLDVVLKRAVGAAILTERRISVVCALLFLARGDFDASSFEFINFSAT